MAERPEKVRIRGAGEVSILRVGGREGEFEEGFKGDLEVEGELGELEGGVGDFEDGSDGDFEDDSDGREEESVDLDGVSAVVDSENFEGADFKLGSDLEFDGDFAGFEDEPSGFCDALLSPASFEAAFMSALELFSLSFRRPTNTPRTTPITSTNNTNPIITHFILLLLFFLPSAP